MTLAAIASLALAGWIASAIFFSFGALRAIRGYLKTAPRPDGRRDNDWPEVLLLRPCEGADPGLEDNLLSSATAKYAGARSVWLTVPSTSDPAYPHMLRAKERASREAPSVLVEILIVAIADEPNRKAAQLAAGAKQRHAPIVIQADSSVRLADDTLATLVHSLLSDPNAGAAYAPPVETTLKTFGDYASRALLTATPHAFYVLAALSAQLRGPKLLAGKLIAHRREVLEAIGGFEAQLPFLGEDMELSRLLHAAGRTLAVSPVPALCTDEGRDLVTILKRYARWSMVVRRQRPWLFFTYPMMLGATPLIFMTTAAFVALGMPWARELMIGAVAVTILRTLLSMWLRPAYRLPADPVRSFAAMWVGELLIDVTSMMGFSTDEIEWRGRRYRVGARGALEPKA